MYYWHLYSMGCTNLKINPNFPTVWLNLSPCIYWIQFNPFPSSLTSTAPSPLAFSAPGLNEVDYSLYPCKEVQLQWLRYYLQSYKKLSLEDQGEGNKSRGGSGPVSEEELESLYVQVNQFALVSICKMIKGWIKQDRLFIACCPSHINPMAIFIFIVIY